jgi:drug/metabolite transporter (DMT)-like permease
MSRTPGRSWPVLQATLGAAVLAPMTILVTLADVGPIRTNVYRCGLALPVLAVLALIERRRLGPRPLASRGYALLGGLLMAVDLVLFNHTITDCGAGISTVVGSAYVPLVALLAWALLRERPDRRYLIVLPTVLVGVVLVSGLIGGGVAGADPAAGVAYAVGASAAYSFFLLVMRKAGAGTRHAAGQLFDATAGATFGVLVIGLLFGGLHLGVSGRQLGWLVLLALSAQVAGWLLITASLPRLPASVSSLLLLVQPAAALLLAAVLLGQWPTLIQVAGAILVCGGVLVVARPKAETAVGGFEPEIALDELEREAACPDPAAP